jgi:8-oxo-dGTP diphosphatase
VSEHIVPRTYGIATSVFAERGGEILILKRAGGAATGAWYTPGGVLDPGETPEVCAARELFEETGLAPTGRVRLFGVIPLFVYERDTFLIHYACECAEGEVRLSAEHSASRWIDAQEYRDDFFSEENVRKVEAAHPPSGAMARSVLTGIETYLEWRAERAR